MWKNACVSATVCVTILFPGTLQADTISLGDASLWTINGNGWGGPSIVSNTLTLTDTQCYERSSAFFNVPQGIGSFEAQFTYQSTLYGSTGGPPTGGDGITFTLQTEGVHALGQGGRYLGYAGGNDRPFGGGGSIYVPGIAPSVALGLNIYPSYTPGEELLSNGTQTLSYNQTNPVDLRSGDPIDVTLSYDGINLQETLFDRVTGTTYNQLYAVNIPGILGGPTAYVGFTGSTGAAYSEQTITNFSFPSAPEPFTFALAAIGAISLLAYAWRRRKGTA